MSTSAQPHQTPQTRGGARPPPRARAPRGQSSPTHRPPHSVGGGERGAGAVGRRRSRRPDAEVIVYSRTEWAAFVAGVKAEEFEPAGSSAN